MWVYLNINCESKLLKPSKILWTKLLYEAKLMCHGKLYHKYSVFKIKSNTKINKSVSLSTIILIIVWDFYQIFLSPQVKRCTNITYKQYKYVPSVPARMKILLILGGGYVPIRRWGGPMCPHKKKKDLRSWEIRRYQESV